MLDFFKFVDSYLHPHLSFVFAAGNFYKQNSAGAGIAGQLAYCGWWALGSQSSCSFGVLEIDLKSINNQVTQVILE